MFYYMVWDMASSNFLELQEAGVLETKLDQAETDRLEARLSVLRKVCLAFPLALCSFSVFVNLMKTSLSLSIIWFCEYGVYWQLKKL